MIPVMNQSELKAAILKLLSELLEDKKSDSSLTFAILVHDKLRNKKMIFEGSITDPIEARNRIEAFIRDVKPPMEFQIAVYFKDATLQVCYLSGDKIYWLTSRDFSSLVEQTNSQEETSPP